MDRRSAVLETTERARAMFPALMEAITAMEKDVLSVLAAGPMGALDDALRALLLGLEGQPSKGGGRKGS
jgi:DNA-binding MarR family transcriptional regulator